MMPLGCISFLFILFAGLVNCHPSSKPVLIEDDRNVSGGRIIGGWEATDGQIPHHASLRMVFPLGFVFSCGGAFIHHNWVISAAHCLISARSLVVLMGATDITRPNYVVDTTRRYIHPNYSDWFPGVQADDIGLVGLDQDVPYGPFIQPIRLQSSLQKNDNYGQVRLTVSGFGLMDDLSNGGELPETLRWVYLRGMTNDECRTWYPNTVEDQTVCAGYYNATPQSACEGDSGGPLTFVDKDGQPTLVGLVRSGASVGCNSEFPIAFVPPGYYHDWFYKITGISFDWDSDKTTVGQKVTLKQ